MIVSVPALVVKMSDFITAKAALLKCERLPETAKATLNKAVRLFYII